MYYFELYCLTDELICQSLGIDTAHSSRLAVLLYTVLFKYSQFDADENIGNGGGEAYKNNGVPLVLVPFLKQILYYLSYFPYSEQSSFSSLLSLSAFVKDVIDIKDNKELE